jgi:ABC-type nitrate/sulfonate/bicarbonate transport system substrate-binding protein
MQDRRDFLKTGFSIAAAGLAGTAALVHARGSVAEEAPPETTSVRLLHWKDTCLAPIDILDDLLRDEGFADVRYVKGAPSDIGADRVASGDADFVQDDAGANILSIDAGVPALMLAGVHPACFELFAHESGGRIARISWPATPRRSGSSEFWLRTSSDVLGGLAFEDGFSAEPGFPRRKNAVTRTLTWSGVRMVPARIRDTSTPSRATITERNMGGNT